MNWTRRLKRVFDSQIEGCVRYASRPPLSPERAGAAGAGAAGLSSMGGEGFRRQPPAGRAIEEPLQQIVENAGEDAAVVLNAVKRGKGAYGNNAAHREYGGL